MKKRGRQIVVDGKTYQWLPRGDAGAIIWDEDDKTDCISLTGLEPYTFERGQHKRTSDGMIISSQIEGWIREHILGGPSRTPGEIADLAYRRR